MRKLTIILAILFSMFNFGMSAAATLLQSPAFSLDTIPNMNGKDYCTSTYPNEATCTLVYNASDSNLILKFDAFSEKIKDKPHNVRGLISDTGDYPTFDVKVYSNKNNLIYSGTIKNKVGLKCDTQSCIKWL